MGPSLPPPPPLRKELSLSAAEPTQKIPPGVLGVLGVSGK